MTVLPSTFLRRSYVSTPSLTVHSLAQWFSTMLEVLNPTSSIHAFIEPFAVGAFFSSSNSKHIYMTIYYISAQTNEVKQTTEPLKLTLVSLDLLPFPFVADTHQFSLTDMFLYICKHYNLVKEFFLFVICFTYFFPNLFSSTSVFFYCLFIHLFYHVLFQTIYSVT